MKYYKISNYHDKKVEKFINTPFIPTSYVTLAAMSDKYPNLIATVENYGIRVIPVSSYKDNTANVEASHADMQILPLGGRKLALIENNDKLNSQLLDLGFEPVFVGEIPESFQYPECVRLNFALAGRNVIGCFKYCDGNILSLLESFNKISVKQGYAKCSVAIVSQNAVITSDSAIHKACLSNGIDSLKICEGNISLCERYGGFIGGACFLLESGTLAFTGDIKAHPDYIKIKSFCLNYGVSLLSLTSDTLCDVGGIVPLMQLSS